MTIDDPFLELAYCPLCHEETWHVLCKDGHLECLGCRATQQEQTKGDHMPILTFNPNGSCHFPRLPLYRPPLTKKPKKGELTWPNSDP